MQFVQQANALFVWQNVCSSFNVQLSSASSAVVEAGPAFKKFTPTVFSQKILFFIGLRIIARICHFVTVWTWKL